MVQTKSQEFFLRFSQRSNTAVIGIGGLVLLGWIFNLTSLKSITPEFVAMNPVTALLFIISGVSLRRSLKRQSSQQRIDWIALTGAVIVTVGGALKLAEYVFQFDLNFDRVPFSGSSTVAGLFPENEIAPNTALNFLFCGIGLILLDTEMKRGFCPAQLCFLLTALVSLLVLIGYAYRVLPLYSIGSAIPMALNTAIAFELFSLAAIAARPAHGVMQVITSDTTAGAIARRLLPAAVLIPLVLGALRFTSERRGLFEVEFGVSLFAVANMIIFTALIWWNARLLYGAEQERVRAERRLALQYVATRVLAESPEVFEATETIMKSICERLGWQAGDLWRVDPDAKVIRCQAIYVTEPKLNSFADASRELTFSVNVGLPGMVWHRQEPIWIEDLGAEKNFSRAAVAVAGGLRSAFAFPVRYNGTICGVMEFFSAQAESRDESLLQTMSAIGTQIGQFIERKLAHEQLKQTSDDLARSNTDLQQFAYIASHDLSEPLRMIVSYLELLSERHHAQLNGEAQEFIGYAVDGAQRMQGMIQDLLAYARVDNRGREFQPTNCEGVLEAALKNLKLVIAETGAVVEHEPLPMVRGDPIQLAQVFQNLISNAIKFRGNTPPRIQIAARRGEREWTFSVQDNGIGIDQKNFERIFVLFQRLHTRQEYPGTGIGLALCKKIIERHGGRIWVESKAGQGTTFFFTLPVSG